MRAVSGVITHVYLPEDLELEGSRVSGVITHILLPEDLKLEARRVSGVITHVYLPEDLKLEGSRAHHDVCPDEHQVSCSTTHNYQHLVHSMWRKQAGTTIFNC